MCSVYFYIVNKAIECGWCIVRTNKYVVILVMKYNVMIVYNDLRKERMADISKFICKNAKTEKEKTITGINKQKSFSY